jgi:Acyl-coenzyme A:6-aminopenicillanic acid acyl-transferase
MAKMRFVKTFLSIFILMISILKEILGHTEDTSRENLNSFYIVSAHIISDEPEGKYGTKEERFSSLCYAGHLPGYTMSYNYHGLM